MFHIDDIPEDTGHNLKGKLDVWLGKVVTAGLLPAEELEPEPDIGLTGMGPRSKAGPDVKFAGYELAETFCEYMLGAETIRTKMNSGEDLSKLVRPTKRRHHQLKLNNQAIAYARSRIAPDGSVGAICQLLVSTLAGSIQTAIRWIDDYEKQHPEYAKTKPAVKLLVVPGHNVYAFWIFKKTLEQSDVLTVAAPPWLKTMKRDRLLTTSEFLKSFDGVHPITGLG